MPSSTDEQSYLVSNQVRSKAETSVGRFSSGVLMEMQKAISFFNGRTADHVE